MAHTFNKLLIFLLVNWSLVEAYKTVVVVHGLNCDASSFDNVKDMIEKYHSGTNVILLKYYEDLATLDPLPEQLDYVVNELKDIAQKNPDGFHLLCHSQGGLICLGAAGRLKNHTIDTFISLSSPLFGQYGIPGNFFDNVPILKPLLNLSRDLISPIIYDDLFQEATSIANYWKDPRSILLHKYERYSSYLPYVLNDPRANLYNPSDAAKRKENILGLNKMVLIGGPGDEVIKPWQSAIFGYYDDGFFTTHIIDLLDQQLYKEDWLGLKALNERGSLVRYIIDGVNHDSWPTFPTVVDKYLGYLT